MLYLQKKCIHDLHSKNRKNFTMKRTKCTKELSKRSMENQTNRQTDDQKESKETDRRPLDYKRLDPSLSRTFINQDYSPRFNPKICVNVCPRSLVYISLLSRIIKIDNTSQTYRMNQKIMLLFKFYNKLYNYLFLSALKAMIIESIDA